MYHVKRVVALGTVATVLPVSLWLYGSGAWSDSAAAVEIPTAVRAAVEKQLSDVGETIAKGVRGSNIPNLAEFSLRLVRPFVSVVGGKAAPSYALFFRFEVRKAGALGGAKVEGVVALTIIPKVNADGTLAVECQSWVLDDRPTAFGVPDLLDGEKKIQNAVDSLLPEKLQDLKDQVIRAIQPAVVNVKVPPLLLGNVPWPTAREVAIKLYPLDQAGVIVDDQTASFAHDEHNNSENAALVVLLGTDNKAENLIWRRPEDLRADWPCGIEKKQSGEMIRILHLAANDQFDNLQKMSNPGRGDWNDRIGCLIIMPGPKYAGEKLAVFTNANFQGQSHQFEPGIWGLRSTVNGVPAGFFKQISSMRVEKP